MYMLVVGLTAEEDGNILVDALAMLFKATKFDWDSISVAFIEDTVEHAALIRGRKAMPVTIHPTGASAEIKEERVHGILVSSAAYNNAHGVVNALNLAAIPHRWELTRTCLREI